MAKLVDVVEISTEVLLDILVEAGFIDDTFLDGEVVDVNITRGNGTDPVLQLHTSIDVDLDDFVFRGEDIPCNEECKCKNESLNEEVDNSEQEAIEALGELFSKIFDEKIKFNAMKF